MPRQNPADARPELLEVLDGRRRRTPKGEERKAAILQALERLLEERDLAEISVGDIARAADVSRSTFYTYFTTREAATAGLLTEIFERMLENVSFLDKTELSPREAIRTGLQGTVDQWMGHRRLILAMLDARGLDREAAELWEYWMDSFRRQIGAAIARQRAAGLTPPGPDPEMLASVLLAANERTLERLARGTLDADQERLLVEALATTWQRAIGVADE